MCALGPISTLSIPLDDAYAHGASEWDGVHGGYSSAFDGGLYTHSDGDWEAVHAPYGEGVCATEDAVDADVFEQSATLEEDTDDGADETSWQAMWAVSHPRLDQEALASPDAMTAWVNAGASSAWASPDLGERPPDDLDDAFEEDPMEAVSSPASLDVSGTGSASFVIERGGAPPNHSVPMSTTSVIVSVPGTDIHQYVIFPDINPTLDITLPGLPPGESDVVIEAFDGTRMVARGEFLVQGGAPPAPSAPPSQSAAPNPQAIPPPPAPAPPPSAPMPSADATPTADPRDRWAAFNDAPLRSGSPAGARAVVTGAAPTSAWEARAQETPPADRTPSAADVSGVVSSTAPRSHELHATPPTASRVETAPPTSAPPSPPDGGTPLEASWSPGQAMGAAMAVSLATATGGVGAAEGEVSAVRATGAERGVPMVAEGAMDILAGYHRRDYEAVWRGALRSEAGGLLFAGSLVTSPLFVALGAVLARAYEAGA